MHLPYKKKGEGQSETEDGIWSPSLALLCVRREAEDSTALAVGVLL